MVHRAKYIVAICCADFWWPVPSWASAAVSLPSLVLWCLLCSSFSRCLAKRGHMVVRAQGIKDQNYSLLFSGRDWRGAVGSCGIALCPLPLSCFSRCPPVFHGHPTVKADRKIIDMAVKTEFSIQFCGMDQKIRELNDGSLGCLLDSPDPNIL